MLQFYRIIVEPAMGANFSRAVKLHLSRCMQLVKIDHIRVDVEMKKAIE